MHTIICHMHTIVIQVCRNSRSLNCLYLSLVIFDHPMKVPPITCKSNYTNSKVVTLDLKKCSVPWFSPWFCSVLFHRIDQAEKYIVTHKIVGYSKISTLWAWLIGKWIIPPIKDSSSGAVGVSNWTHAIIESKTTVVSISIIFMIYNVISRVCCYSWFLLVIKLMFA